MKPHSFRRQGIRFSLTLHGIVLVLVLVGPLFFRGCQRLKKPEQVMMVEFTVSIPPPPEPAAPPTPEPPAPEPPKPVDDIKVPDPDKPPPPAPPKPPKPPTPPKDIRQTNVVVRNAPPPKDKPLSPEEIARRLKQGAVVGTETKIPADDQLAFAAYLNRVRELLYAVWQQPAQLSSLPGLSADVRITVAPDGSITGHTKTRGSGNALMDDSVIRAISSVKKLPALPVGYRTPQSIGITFKLDN